MIEKIPEMDCILRDRLAQQNLSVRRLAEQGEKIPGTTPSYSTIDNFIRKGTGHLDTAWSICKMLGITLDDAFVEKLNDNTLQVAAPHIGDIRKVLKEIIDHIISKEKIRSVGEIADILFTIGEAITRVGFNEEAAQIIRIAQDAVVYGKPGGDDCE